MKKIVALVLSLVMVLGLATTAFAATTSTGSVSTATVTPVKATLYSLASVGGAASMDKDATITTINTIEVTTVTGKIDNDVPKYVPTIYSINGDLFIQVAKASANHALYNNGAYVYLYDIAQTDVATKDTGAIDLYATDVAMDSIVIPADEDIDCGDAYTGDLTATPSTAKLAPYYVSGDDVYYVVPAQSSYTGVAYFNGEFVTYDAVRPVTFKNHDWDYDTVVVRDTDVKGVKVPVTVECKDCEKTFPVVGDAKFDNTWVKNVNYDNFAGQGYTGVYYIVLDEVTAVTPVAPEATDKVESAETFDAGIAMYVGMSVMAAAGSAVVLKKKD